MDQADHVLWRHWAYELYPFTQAGSCMFDSVLRLILTWVFQTPEMLVVKLGGPAYRIGMGGGAASSMVQGENKAHLDFNAVQRGDAQMEQKTNRVIRKTCWVCLLNRKRA